MGIRFLCPNGHKLNVKADLAGKRAVCPECGAKLMIPAASAPPKDAPPAAVVVESTPPGASWYLRSATGEQLGPLSELQFRAWIAAGRVTADSPLWREGWPEWKLARNAADLLPTPLVATAVAATTVSALPVAPSPDPIAAPAERVANIADVPSVSDDVVADEISVAPATAETSVNKSSAVAASTYVNQRQRSKQKQLTLAIALLLAVVVLAGVLLWVVSLNSAPAAETTSQQFESHSPSPTVSH